MRLRRHYKNYRRSVAQGIREGETIICEEERAEKSQNTEREPKKTKEATPMRMIRQIINNPNFNLQLIVILLSLTSDNMQMDRRIDGMTTTIDKVRNITELVNNGMQSMKTVSEVPKSIRRLLE